METHNVTAATVSWLGWLIVLCVLALMLSAALRARTSVEVPSSVTVVEPAAPETERPLIVECGARRQPVCVG
jgi:hypothetical protein